MQPLSLDADIALMDEELAWCASNPAVPEAAEVLRLHRVHRDDPTAGALGVAAKALRRLRPRPPALVNRLFVFVLRDPAVGVEGMPSLGAYPLIGNDLEGARFLRPQVEGIRRIKGDDSLKLVRFDLDRAIGDRELAGLKPAVSDGLRIEELFAFVGPPPIGAGPGDEMIGAALFSRGPRLLLDADVENVRKLASYVAAMRAAGQPMELRRFVRGEQLPDPWNAGGQSH